MKILKIQNSLLLLLSLLTNFQQLSPAAVALRSDFFEELTGVTEPEFVRRQLTRQVLQNGYVNNLKTKTSLPAGVFCPYSIAQLNARIKDKDRASSKGVFNVIVGYNTRHLPLKKRAMLDIQALQAAPENNGALFQVASNFDCLESASSADDRQHWLSEYVHDMTQGPFAAISAAPGLLLRRYGLKDPINLLANFPYFQVRNGYLVLDKAGAGVLARAADLDHEQIMVGVHQDVGVAYGQLLNADKHLTCVNKEQIISQVYVSALDFGSVSGNALGKKINNPGVREQVEALAKKLLLAAYEGTIKAAIAFGKKKVFLTLVGCGVFNNKLEWVQEAIESCLGEIQKYGLDVTLVVYDANARKDMAPFLNVMKKIAEKTDGEYRELYEAFAFVQSESKGRLR